jgi:hypothetical protein
MGTAETYWGTSIFHEATGVTYHFASPVQYGYYWNGDPFVVAGGQDITITSISPEWSGSGRVMHGTMVQPDNDNPNGFGDGTPYPPYDAATNLDPAKTGANLVVDAASYPTGASIVKAVSLEAITSVSVIDKFSVLTVVPSTPPADAFRPPVVGTDKTSHYTLDDLDFSKLQSVTPVAGQDPIGNFDWLKDATFVSWYSGSANSRGLHPDSYHAGYNDYQLDDTIVPALMALHSSYTNAEKLDLYAAIVQQGIDYAAFNNIEGIWLSTSTHVELFPPILATAAVALNSQEIRDALLVPRSENFFYVGADDVGVEYFSSTSSLFPSFATYQDAQVGMPEWQITSGNPDPALIAAYRSINSDNVPITALLMEMLGDGEGRAVINNEAYFDYAERMRLIFDANPKALSPTHAQSKEWTAFIDAYHSTYTAGSSTELRPEAPSVSVSADGANIQVVLNGDVFAGSAPITRVDVRYKAADEGWTIIEDFGMSGSIPVNQTGLYFVQARLVSSAGEGPWSGNDFTVKNNSLDDILLAEGIVTQEEIDALGGMTRYRLSDLYKEHVRSIWEGRSGFEKLADDLTKGSVVITTAPDIQSDVPDPDIEPDPIIYPLVPDSEPADPVTEPSEPPIIEAEAPEEVSEDVIDLEDLIDAEAPTPTPVPEDFDDWQETEVIELTPEDEPTPIDGRRLAWLHCRFPASRRTSTVRGKTRTRQRSGRGKRPGQRGPGLGERERPLHNRRSACLTAI